VIFRVSYFVGLDLGQSYDYTAICVIEDISKGGEHSEATLNVRHLQRFRDVLYPDVADRVEALLDREPLRHHSTLIIDATGVGPAVTDIFSKRGVPSRL
jgi:hypothetical protein